jgi:hypothetical protein
MQQEVAAATPGTISARRNIFFQAHQAGTLGQVR